MSITVNDIMKLPSLRSASVVAGHGGMQRSIASISVLESIDTDILGGLFFPSDHFVGSEIVITGFLNCREDEEQQCKLIRALAEGGEIGIILYYVGVCVPKVGEKIKRLCDELGKDGGFILSEGKMLSYRNDAKRENYKAVCDFVSSYRL